MPQLSVIRTFLENNLTLPSTDSFVNSTLELQYINQAYYEVSEQYDWNKQLKRFANVITANVDRYSLQSDFRKFDFVFNQGQQIKGVGLDTLKFEKGAYSVSWDTSEVLLSDQPASASTPYTLLNSETAGSTVTIELDTVSGISAGDEIWFNDSTSSEFTVVQSVDTTNKTITAKIANNHSAGVILYRVLELLYFGYYKEVTALANTTDTPSLPTSLHLPLAYYAAYLYYTDLEETDKANARLNMWERAVQKLRTGNNKNSTGTTTQFSI